MGKGFKDKRRYMDDKQMKRHSTSLVITEMQIKSTIRYHYIPDRRPKINQTDNPNYGPWCRATGTFIHYWQDWLLLQKTFWGNSLVVQWLRFVVPNAGSPDSIPGHGTRFHIPQWRLKTRHSQINKKKGKKFLTFVHQVVNG